MALKAQVLRLEEVFDRKSQIWRLEKLIAEVQQALQGAASDEGRPLRVSVVIPKGGIQVGVNFIIEGPKPIDAFRHHIELKMARAKGARVMTSEEFIHACNSLIKAGKNGTWSFNTPQI